MGFLGGNQLGERSSGKQLKMGRVWAGESLVLFLNMGTGRRWYRAVVGGTASGAESNPSCIT